MNVHSRYTTRFLLFSTALAAAVAILLTPLVGQAQSTSSEATEGPRTAYLVHDAKKLPVVLLSARTSLENESDGGFNASAADVVVVGAAVKALVTDGPHTHALKKGLHNEVRVVACEYAMENTGVTESDLIEGIDTARNGYHEFFRLQDLGYGTVQL